MVIHRRVSEPTKEGMLETPAEQQRSGSPRLDIGTYPAQFLQSAGGQPGHGPHGRQQVLVHSAVAAYRPAVGQ